MALTKTKITARFITSCVEAPLRQIVSNAGGEPSVVVDKAGKGNFGFNAATGEYGDMIELGILDPTKVTRLPYKTPRPLLA